MRGKDHEGIDPSGLGFGLIRMRGIIECIARRNPMPTDQTRNRDRARSQGDHSTLYVSPELSRSSWLVTSLSPNSDETSKYTIAAGEAPK